MLQAINFLSGDNPNPVHGGRCGGRIQQCWEFVHPRRDALLDSRGAAIRYDLNNAYIYIGLGLPLTNSHNTRSASLTFAIPHAGILHGFAGYFEAVLYGNIGLSIHPDRMHLISKDMLSWFPCFFPTKVSALLEHLATAIFRDHCGILQKIGEVAHCTLSSGTALSPGGRGTARGSLAAHGCEQSLVRMVCGGVPARAAAIPAHSVRHSACTTRIGRVCLWEPESQPPISLSLAVAAGERRRHAHARHTVDTNVDDTQPAGRRG